MIKILLLAVVPFMTQHRNVVPKTEVSTNFYGSVTGVVTTAYIQERSSIELPEKWALANVTNANGKSVNASDVGALGNSGSQTLNQSYNGLSVTFDAEGALYTGQYAPSKWSITKELNDQYYYVQFFGFNGTNYPSFNLFDGESDFYIRLPRKEGTLALQSDVESKADRPALPYAAGNLAALTADGNLSDSGIAKGNVATKNNLDGYLPLTGGIITGRLHVNESLGAGRDLYATYFSTAYNTSWGDVVPALYYSRWYYLPNGSEYPKISDNEIAVKGDISATNPTFSNAVLAVGLNIDTNSVAVLNEIADTFGGFPIGGTATTVGGLLAALAAAAAWLKKNKVGSFDSVGGATATVENGVAKLNDFFTNSNSLLTGAIDEEIIEKGTAPDAHLEAPTDERLKLVLADNSVAYDSAKALPYKLTSVIGDRVIATMTLTAASTDITLPTIAANDTTVKDFILDVTNAYAVEGVATDAGINIPRTDFKLVTRDGESLTDVTTVKAGKSAFLCFTQKAPVVVGGTTYPCWCVIQLPFGDPS